MEVGWSDEAQRSIQGGEVQSFGVEVLVLVHCCRACACAWLVLGLAYLLSHLLAIAVVMVGASIIAHSLTEQ